MRRTDTSTHQPRPSLQKQPAILATLHLGIACAFLLSLATPAASAPATTAPASAARIDDATVSALVTAEETALVLTRRLTLLAEGLKDLRLPGPRTEAAAVFAPSVSVIDLLPLAPPARPATLTLEPRLWPVAAAPSAVASVDLWRPFLDGVAYFEHARFTVAEGDHPNGNMLQYDSDIRFEGLTRMKSGEWRAVQAELMLSWVRSMAPDGRPDDWQISAWKTGAWRWNVSPRRLFTEVLDKAVRAPLEAATLRRSQHYEATVKYYREGMKKLPHPYFAPISVNQKEGLAIADVNADGFDDIYLSVRLGKNLLLINHGDGTFSEQAARYRLDLPGHTTCSLFADFDNDGDLDVMLGRSLLKASYLENRDGVYVQHPIPKFMPMAVISMAAADYNGDGLLDIYLCTYRPAPPAGAGAGGGFAAVAKEGDFDWPDEFFSPEVARDFRRRLAEHKQRMGVTVLDQLGPPNMLLVNRGGGRFEPAPETATVGLWRNSLQATWCDYNRDGRPDLYIPNDWGMNVLFRNDGPTGFTDVTREAGLNYYGFSMGASWGDYDNDGRDDLYVSNMYSEVGRRITRRIPGLDKAFAESAAGNYLYHRATDGSFQQVAGLQSPAMTVMKAGWSWGGCFADFDNDSFLDLYVLNGYFTAPPELASDLDLESNLWRTMVRADASVARPSFRFSPEWRRTRAPDNLGPQIDARLAGVEKQGDRVAVHSLHGSERNRYFANQGGRSFADASGISGLDNAADSRGFGILDFDRDGWQDIALVNANQPLFNLYRNEMPSAGIQGGVIAIRFVGGNKTPAPSTLYACRDGFGARVAVDLDPGTIVREHRCGDGWSVQNSSTMIVGIGTNSHAKSVSIRWPSGNTSVVEAVPEGTWLTVFENPADSPSGMSFTQQPYRVEPKATPPSPPGTAVVAPAVFAVHALDNAAKPARLRVYSAFTTSCVACRLDLPALRRLVEELRPEGIDVVAVPVDPADDDPRLAAYAQQWKPASRFINIPAGKRAEMASAFGQAIGQQQAIPCSVVTDGSGRILSAQPGVPTVSALRRLLTP